MRIKQKISIILFPIIAFIGTAAFADEDLSNFKQASEGCANAKYCKEMSVVSATGRPVAYKVTCKSLLDENNNPKKTLPQYEGYETNYFIGTADDGHQWAVVYSPGKDAASGLFTGKSAGAAFDQYCMDIYGLKN